MENGQAPRTSTTSCQPRRSAIGVSIPTSCWAWESPTTITRLAGGAATGWLQTSPATRGVGAQSQWSTCTQSWATVTGGGASGAGTTGAPASARAPGWASTAATVAGAARYAAASCQAAVAARTAISIAAHHRTRVRSAGRARPSGRSTRWCDSTARTSDAATIARPSGSPTLPRPVTER